GSAGGAPNSRMSAPPMKMAPAPVMTIATIPAVASPCAMAASRPLRTSVDSALTGAWSISINSTALSTVPRTVSEKAIIGLFRNVGGGLDLHLSAILDQGNDLNGSHG